MTDKSPATNRTLDRKYRLLRVLGRGGMGEVHEAEHTGTGRRVAVKLVHGRLLAQGDEAESRFRREARAAGALQSPHIVEVLDAGEDGATGDLFLVMEYLHGEDLQHLVDRVGPLLPDVALRIAAQALAGLAKAHEAGIVHRDVKPANLFLARGEGGDVTVKVLDFGIAKVTQEATCTAMTTGLTKTEGLLGSPLYMSPEQMQSSKGVDHRTDLWSLGSALYCALAGRAPYRHVESVLALLTAILAGSAPPLRDLAPWVPEEVARVVGRALAIAPDDRYPSAAAMLDAIRALVPGGTALREEMLAGVSPEVRASAPPAAPPPIAARHLVLAGGGTSISGDAPTLAAGAGATTPAPPRAPASMRRRVFLAGAGAAASLLGLGGYLRWRARGAARPAVAAEHDRITFRGDASEPTLSPDGKWLAYIAGKKKLVVRDVATGTERDAYVGHGLHDVQWIDDGSALWFSDAAPPSRLGYIVSTSGGSARATAGSAGSRRYSPDGKEAVEFGIALKEIRVFDVRAGELAGPPKSTLRLTGDFTWLRDVEWSPSGRWLLVATTRSSTSHTLLAIRRDGSVQRPLFEDVADADESMAFFRWAPRENAFYYFRQGPARTRELVKAGFDPSTGEARGDRTVLLTGLGAASSFSITADGRRLAYARVSARTALWLVTLEGPDGAAAPKATKLDAGILERSGISVSPDGERAAFAQTERGAHVFTLALKGGAPKQVSFVEGLADIWSTAWSPDGAEIAFLAVLKNGDKKLYRVPAGGGEARAIGDAPLGDQICWSPGQRILYQTLGNRNLRVLDPVSHAESPLLSREVGWVLCPCTSPDGKHVAVYWNRVDGQPAGIYGISLDDRSSRLLAPDLFPLGYGDDGRTIYAQDGSRREILRVPADGGAPSRLASLPLDPPADEIALVPGSRRFLCAVTETDSDIWFVDGFDPEAAAR